MAYLRAAFLTVITGTSLLLLATAVTADLPVVRPPEEPPADQDPARNVQDIQAEARRRIIDQARQGRQDVAGANGGAARAVDLEILMKRVSDPKAPVWLKWKDQLAQVSGFKNLTAEQQDKAIPELLHLLRSKAPLSYRMVLPKVRPMQVRHRANAALTRLAGVFFGQFPGGDARQDDTPDRRESEEKASRELVARWAAWWKEVKEQDLEGRKAAANRLRRELVVGDDLDVALINLTLINEVTDISAMDILIGLVERHGAQTTPFANLATQVFARFCARPEAGHEARLVLLDLITAANTPDAAGAAGTRLRNQANVMRRITGIPVQYEWVVITRDAATGQEARVRVIKKETIDAWREALAKQAEKVKAEKADPTGPAADPNSHVGGA